MERYNMELRDFVEGFIANLSYAFGVKSFKFKILYASMLAIILSPLAYLFEFIRNFLIPERYFFQTVIFLCLVDAAMGIKKSFKLKRFSPLLLILGLSTKLGVSYVAMQIFQALSSPPELAGSPDVKNYFVLTWKLLIMSYPAVSAFNNIFYITDGRFPPLWWMQRQADYQKTGDINKIFGKGKNDTLEPTINTYEKE